MREISGREDAKVIVVRSSVEVEVIREVIDAFVLSSVSRGRLIVRNLSSSDPPLLKIVASSGV